MDVLPVMSDGKQVYAGFWKRFYAGLIDLFVIIMLWYPLAWLQGFDRTLAIIILVPSWVLFSLYNVFFHARFGATPGKLAAGVKVTKPDGSAIGWSEAWKRSSVDLVLAAVMLSAQISALLSVDPMKYSSLEYLERCKLVQEHYPEWHESVSIFQQVWVWSELVVLLLNDRKRALHDFIAGTVVIHKQFAQKSQPDQLPPL